MEGHSLTGGEMKYLTYSSKLLSRFLDKKLFQRAVQLTKPHIIEEVCPLHEDRNDDRRRDNRWLFPH